MPVPHSDYPYPHIVKSRLFWTEEDDDYCRSFYKEYTYEMTCKKLFRRPIRFTNTLFARNHAEAFYIVASWDKEGCCPILSKRRGSVLSYKLLVPESWCLQ